MNQGLLGSRQANAAGIASYFRSLIRRNSVRPGVAVSPDELATVAQPTLFAWGDDDVFLKPVDASRSIVAVRDSHLIRVPRAGHAPWLQAPTTVGSAVAEHLRASPAMASVTDPITANDHGNDHRDGSPGAGSA